MSLRKIGEARTEGYRSEIFEDVTGRVFFVGDADIDADGANGQNGGPPAYHRDPGVGTEALANGGMARKDGLIVGVTDWWQHIVFVANGRPLVLANGVIPSRTAYQFPESEKRRTLAAMQVDSETVPYIVVPPLVVSGVKGIVKGCKAAATWKGRRVLGMVGDVGPRTKVGEVSIAMARALGIPSSPRTGGLSTPEVLYELWPGQFAEIASGPDGRNERIPLMRLNGTYLLPS